MLHAIHATEQLIHNIVIHTPDTDVVVIALSVSEIYIKLFLYQNWFKKQKENPKPQWRQVISCNTKPHNDHNDVNQKEFLDALLGIYAFTGSDTVSAFAYHDKIRTIKLMAKTRDVKLFPGLRKTSKS